MRGEKVVKFDFDISYPNGQGGYDVTREIRVREPGLGKFDVYSTMKGFVGQALLGISKARAEVTNKGPKKVLPEKSNLQDDEPEQSEEQDDEQDVMIILQMGLDVQTYSQVAVYVQRVLTNTPKIASMGDSRTPVTDEVWTVLEEHGGMDAVNKVMSEFVGFFFTPQRSRKKTGSSEPIGSAGHTRVTSATSASKISRSKN